MMNSVTLSENNVVDNEAISSSVMKVEHGDHEDDDVAAFLFDDNAHLMHDQIGQEAVDSKDHFGE